MAFPGLDPGDPNNWYQSPQLGLFPVRPTGYCCGISGACYLTHSSHPHGSPSYPPPPFPFQPSYSPPPPPPSQTIINGYVFLHQFPCVSQTHAQFSPPPQLQPIYPTAQQPLTTTPQSPSIPHSNPNPWIYPPISQSHSCDPHSQFVSTKPMTTTPIYHSAPSPPVRKLQVHKQHTEAKLCEMRESLKSSMDTFIYEFREELRLLRGSLQSPASQVDNPLKFGSPSPSSTPESIPAATEASSSLIHADNGIICKTPVDSDLNLSSIDVILGFCDNASMNHVAGSTTIDSIATLVCGDKSMEVVGGVNTSWNNDKSMEVVGGVNTSWENDNKSVTDGFNPDENDNKSVTEGFNPDDSKEFQELLYDGTDIHTGYIGDTSTDLAGGNFPQPKVKQHIDKKGADRASLLFKSMPQFNDIDFLLNPQMTVTDGNRDCTVVAVDKIVPCIKAERSHSICAQAENINVQKSKELLHGFPCQKEYDMRSKEDSDVEIEVSNVAYESGSKLLVVFEPPKQEAVEKLVSRVKGFISNEDHTCPDCNIEQQITTTDEFDKEKFALLYRICKLGHFDQAKGILYDVTNRCFDSIMIIDNGFLNGNIGEENLCAGDKGEKMPVTSEMVLEKIWVKWKSEVHAELDSEMAIFPADAQSEAKGVQRLILCLQLCHCEIKEAKLFCKEAFEGLGELTQTIVSQVFTTIIFGPQYLRAAFDLVLYDLYKLYVVIHNPFNDNAVNLLPDDKKGFLTVFGSQFCDVILLKANPCQPTTWGQIVSLRFDTAMIYLLIPNVKLIFIIDGMTHNNLNRAALPIALWSPQMCKDIDQLQTHSTIIITLVVGVISENINDQTKAISQPRSFSIDEIIDILQINLEFSSSRYSSDPLLSICYGVVLMPNMHKFSQYMVGHVHKDDYFLATSSSNFYSSVHAIHALVRKLFPLSPMAAIRPLLVNMIREDAHRIRGIMLVISMIELVSLKSKKQGFEIMYGDVSDGNYCSHMRCFLYFLDFLITWFIVFGFVVIVSVDLALVPQNFFSVPMRSNEAPLLILMSRNIHSQAIEFVNSSHPLQGPNREALRISATSHVGVHLCALMHNCVFKYSICLSKQRMEFPWNYMPYNKLAIFLNWIIETWSGFKEVTNIDTTLQPTVGVFNVADNSSTGTDSEKMSERDLHGDIIKTLLYVISEIIHVAPYSLDNFSAYLQPSRYDRGTSITAELSNENCNDSQHICGIVRLVLGLAGSVGAMYRAGADDAIFNINNVMVSWVPHMNRLVQGSFHHLIQWGITLEFVSTISIYGCFFYNNLGATFDNTMALQLVSIVDYALGTSFNAFDRYWDKMFLLLTISAVLEPQMPKIIFGDLDSEAGINFGRHFRLEVKPAL